MMEQGPPLPPDDRCRVFGHVNIWRQVEEEEEEGDGEKRMEEYVEKMVTHVDKALVMITMLDGDEVLATTTTSSGGGSSSNTLVKMVSDDGGEEQKERRIVYVDCPCGGGDVSVRNHKWPCCCYCCCCC